MGLSVTAICLCKKYDLIFGNLMYEFEDEDIKKYIEKIHNGEFTFETKIESLDNSACEFDATISVHYCEKCGQWENDYNLDLLYEGTIAFENVRYCKKCGCKLNRITYDDVASLQEFIGLHIPSQLPPAITKIRKLKCPRCRSRLVCIPFFWGDID